MDLTFSLLGCSKYLDCYNFADGSAVICTGCHEEKGSDDPAIAGSQRWWNVHGRPSDPGSHGALCLYCEKGWKMKRPDLTQDQYAEWIQTEEGAAANTGWTSAMVDIRIAKGANARFSAKQVASWEAAPVQLKRQTADETEVIELDEEFIVEEDGI